ncbi:metal ABC transporter substrate-binding protein [Pandoraea aquatica]|uniref:Metal ABC transporter substrate-binding protein n=1 Tax=Pandoraea aquatica TaxID=2508290 RepID=A0A5E4YXV4_9BURK|nr:zinc ABC transporter substrate-binding protein [Pandoraea aquatica]VVE52733.1 metal ABC transporter substrate-binding protein [Pandoraea aquatica]
MRFGVAAAWRQMMGLAVFVGLMACVPAHAAQGKLNVVASFSVLADIVQSVGGDRITVTSLIPRNRDAHHFEPSPADVAEVRKADVVFVHGVAGFEGYLPRLIAASGYTGPVVTVSDGVKLRTRVRKGVAGDDPHTWNNPMNAVIYVGHIKDALEAKDPAGRAEYEANAARYITALKAIDADARQRLGKIPEAQRVVISSHAAFGYLGDAYGITFLSPMSISTADEPSAKHIAALIDQIRKERVSAYFVENSNNPRLVELVAKATNVKPGGELYAEALSDSSGSASTYLDMLRHNVDTLATALENAPAQASAK